MWKILCGNKQIPGKTYYIESYTVDTNGNIISVQVGKPMYITSSRLAQVIGAVFTKTEFDWIKIEKEE